MQILRRKITVLSAILLFTTGFGFGMAAGYRTWHKPEAANQTTIEIKDLNAKKGGVIQIETETKQEQKKKTKKKGFLNLFN